MPPATLIHSSYSVLTNGISPGPAGAGPVPTVGGGEKGETSRTGEAVSRVGESSVQVRSSGGGDSIRTGQTQEHIAREDASFAVFLDTTVVSLSPEAGKAEAVMKVSGPDREPRQTNWGHRYPALSAAEQETVDGANVVALLSAAGSLEPDLFEPADETMSRSDLSSLRRALFGEAIVGDKTSSVAWDSVLNFIPDYLRVGESSRPAAADDLATHLGTTDSGAAWQAWIGQWSQILTGYQDEIWGDLGSLAEEARLEVQKLSKAPPNQKPPNEPTALLRLRAILGHLRSL
ncbi:hypothetical protein B0T26DRAFT_669767 [Lasiosphaeria miniovina]|uniref:Uncharacterized protein n=1 Tax=Lasiosphaeria miniovina TaxID=1954250 RepID=A0AA40BFL3_9PEZI|nr:uncharacterized protein B0T26DRAFT_669767 [Lasiosphaeria miniovina]KAK0733351.1 hypothetical protein B0T26DRAFT_669767 [Lasiosphaeria miniovina]